MRRGIAVAGTLLILGLGAIGAVQKPWSEGVAPEILDWAEGAIESWLDAAEQNSDTTCAAGAQAALDGLAISNAWLWTDEDLTDADGNPTDALTELNDPDAVKEWVDSGKTDTSFPGGDLTKLDVTVYGEKEGDGWRIKPSGHLAFTIAHEALHWLPGGGPNHTLAAFTQLENCHIKEEEEEDDDEPGEGGGESTETCEDVWRPALTT
ncbi:MAG: hypothetical protein F4Z31_09150, partial [Gemmatimonadetes bacterium]|nr:hypothetical protein [Gemmatimonadota bacterium]MYJ11524.1 hypothetical protein [Gemmatimonadota bacterium]